MSILFRFLLLNFCCLSVCISSNAYALSNLLIVGDSLSAAYGIDPDKSWPTLLQQKLDAEKIPFTVVNISVSGNTTQDGLDKLPDALKKYQPSVVIVALGANDGLRGLPATLIEKNLSNLVKLSEDSNAKVLLVGILIPLNYGPVYRKQFENVYKNVVRADPVAKIPFMLDGVALQPKLLLKDQLHPNEKAQPIILNNIWPTLKTLLEGLKS